jgi:ribosome maturation factor RimP
VSSKQIEDSDDLLARLEQLARRAAEPFGLEVAWVELKRHGGSTLFRVFIDQESGVGLEDCQRVTERLGVILDVEDPIEPSYTLEVSSPGLDRPLWSEKDYQRYAGRLARIKTKEALDGKRQFRGRLAGVEEHRIVLENRQERVSIPFPAIESGRLEVELFAPRPNKPKRKTRPAVRRRS